MDLDVAPLSNNAVLFQGSNGRQNCRNESVPPFPKKKVPNRPTACRVEMIEALGRRQRTAFTMQVATVYRDFEWTDGLHSPQAISAMWIARHTTHVTSAQACCKVVAVA